MVEQKKYSSFEQFNLLKNNLALSTPLILTILVGGLIGGLIVFFIGLFAFQDYLPLKMDHMVLYLNAVTQFGSDTVSYKDVVYDVATIENKLGDRFWQAMTQLSSYFVIGFIVSIIATLFITLKIAKKNAAAKLNEKFLRGTTLINEDLLAVSQDIRNVDGYKITEKVKIDREHECKHILISGSIGSGKTVLLTRLMRNQMQHPLNVDAKFIINDVKGDWIQKHYNPETDFIYNFSDERSIYFNIFGYIEDMNELESIIATIIPRSPDEKEPIWTDSSRGILKGILIYCIATNQKNMKLVNDMIHFAPNVLKRKLKEVEGTETAIQYLSAGETQVANYMSSFVSKVKFFDTIPNSCHKGKENFDITKWLESKGQSKIFLLNNVKDQELNGVRIALFVDTLIKIILDFKESKERRIYLFLDELGAVARMESLEKGITIGRSFGLSVIAGIQEIAKFDKIYGQHDRKTIINNLTNKIFLNVGDEETAKAFSAMIGEVENEETDVSSSIGTESNRDGVSFSKKKKKEFAVLPSEIMGLPPLEFYIKQHDQNWAKIKTEYIPEVDSMPILNETFKKCKDLKLNFKVKGAEKEQAEEIEISEDEISESSEKDSYTFG